MESKLKLLISISKSMNILYVEDREDVRKQTLKLLKNFFNDIDIAVDGKFGLEKFKKNSYHIILTDLEMPVMDGLTMIKNIRKIDNDIPIIVFSAHSRTEYFLDAIKLGIDGYILKPYDLMQISELIAKVMMKLDIQIKTKNHVRIIGNHIWDKEKKVLTKDNKIVKLTKNESKLFEILTLSVKYFTKSSDIESHIFGCDTDYNKKARNLISRLRKKLGVDLIESGYGIGYRLKTD